jgi:hypothetical protein
VLWIRNRIRKDPKLFAGVPELEVMDPDPDPKLDLNLANKNIKIDNNDIKNKNIYLTFLMKRML